MGAELPNVRSPSIVPSARTCTFSTPDLHLILGVVRTMHRAGAVKWLQRTTGKSPRACKYWLAGEYAPKGADTLSIVRTLRVELDALNSRLKQFELDLS